ncbi:MAG: Glycerol-3-phosphate ABC transporter, periplasmic glycerol-3-phosphate-binding protein [uncultured Chloroflexi bacterium]|uniref:Glycerol-3-phosphate ABC transporter, periplasmic glycerol-3-phosphate-binding protein n=1 Tax=uncultured Chloroflexota bacterium TaxID=166587 RepID=A0A6J4KDB9_9CHLR|nr:MAG: Glycerol-3-phosphate ABC transporter, periplasmic glycerol-3-phosphate-binding protein [uncultured Chloroflexota bacterium]
MNGPIVTASGQARHAAPKPFTRRGLGGAGLGVVGVLGAACGAGQGAGGASGAETTAQGKRFAKQVEIEYWKSISGLAHDAQVKLTNDFNASRQDVKVNLVDAGGYDQGAEKFQAAAAGGTPPDVMLFTVDSYGRPFARMGLLAPVDEFLKADKAVADKYLPGLMKDGQVSGKQYQVPFSRSTEILLVNKDQLKAAGLPETAPATWQELNDTAQKLLRAGVTQAPSNGGDKFTFSALALWWSFQSMLWAFGGRYSDEKFNVTVTEPAAVAAAQYLQDMVYKTRIAQAYKSSGNARTDFVTGVIPLYIQSTSGLTAMEKDASFRVGAAFVPKHKEQAVHSGGSGLNIIQASAREKKEASWEFVKFMTNVENTIYFSQQTGYMVVRTDAIEQPAMKDYLAKNPNARVVFDQARHIKATDEIATAPQAIKYIDAALAKILTEQAPVRATFEGLTTDLKQSASQVPGR